MAVFTGDIIQLCAALQIFNLPNTQTHHTIRFNSFLKICGSPNLWVVTKLDSKGKMKIVETIISAYLFLFSFRYSLSILCNTESYHLYFQIISSDTMYGVNRLEIELIVYFEWWIYFLISK